MNAFPRITPRIGHLVLFAAVVAGMALRVEFFRISVTHLQPSSDESISMLQAQDIRSGAYPLLFMAQPYLFPIESYLAAPMTGWLPPTAWSARLIPTILQALAVALGLVLLRRLARGWAFVAGAALILIPSSYLLLMQAAYRPPAYSSLILLFTATLWMADRARASGRPTLLVLTGLLGGLAFSGHMLAACFVGPAVVHACMAGSWRTAAVRTWWAGIGIFVGLLPHIASTVFMPGAHAAVMHPVSLADALYRLRTHVLTYSLVTACGLRLANFVDEDVDPEILPGLDHAFAFGVTIFLAALLAARLFRVGRIALQERRFEIELVDLVLMAAVANILAVAANLRAHAGSIRYLVIAAFSLPLLLAWAATRHRYALRAVVACAALLLCVNVRNANALMERWRQPWFPASVGVADLNPTLDFLESRDIRHVLASYGAAYRITYQSDRRILGAQRHNERYHDWPVPYRDEVQRADRVAFVLSDTISHLKPATFDRHLDFMHVSAAVHTAGAFLVYHDFRSPYSGRELPTRFMRASASSADDTAPRMLDRDPRTYWMSEHRQRGGEWVALEWPQEAPMDHVVLDLSHGDHDYPKSLDVELRIDGQWSKVYAGLPVVEDKFQLVRGQPRYLTTTFTTPFAGQRATGLRLRVVEPNTERAWTLPEVTVYVATHDAGLQSVADSTTTLPSQRQN